MHVTSSVPDVTAIVYASEPSKIVPVADRWACDARRVAFVVPETARRVDGAVSVSIAIVVTIVHS